MTGWLPVGCSTGAGLSLDAASTQRLQDGPARAFAALSY